MKKVPIKKDHELLNAIVFDKKTKENGIIISLNPLKILLDREKEKIVERSKRDLLVYVYEKGDIDYIKEEAQKLAKFFSVSSKKK